MTEVERLRVIYELQDQQFRAGMERMRNMTRLTNDQIIAQAKRAELGLASMGRAFAGAFSVAVVAGVSQKLTRIADAATQMQNSLRVAGLEGAELSRVYDQLFKSAQKNAAPIGSLVDLYSKLALAQDTLGVSSQDLIKFTDGISVALRVGGTDAQAASGSLLQLSQALGGGVVRAEEFNSILEGTPTIARAVAKGLKEAGGSVSTLRTLVTDGKVSSAAFFQAFQVGSEELRAQADSSQITVGQALVRIGNSLLTVVGDFDRASGASSYFAESLSDVASGIDDIDVSGLISKIQAVINAFSEAERAGTSWLNSVGNSDIFARLNEATGVTEGGQIVNPDVSEAENKIATLERLIEGLQAQIESDARFGLDTSGAVAQLQNVRAELAAVRAEAAGLSRYVDGIRRDGSVVQSMMDSGTFYDGSNYSPPPAPAKSSGPVSIADFPAAPPSPGGGSGRKRSGRGGGRTSGGQKKTAADVLFLGENDIRDLERQISLLGKSNREVATAEARWAMLDAAKKAGIPVNDEMNAKIEAQAAQIGGLTEQLEQAQLAQEQFDQAIEGVADAFAGALVAGESLRDGLAQVFKQIASDIINSGIRDALMGQFGGGGGWLGSLFGGLFGGGDPLASALRGAGLPAVNSYDGGGFTGFGSRSGGIDGKGGFPAILHPNETVLDHTRGQSIGGGSMAVHITASFDQEGNAYVKRVTRGEILSAAPQIVGQSVQASKRSMNKSKAGWGL